MFDSQGLPPYPPRQNAWQFPPPPIQKRWKWLAIAATALSAVVAILLTTTIIVLETRDAPGLIDDTDLTAIIDDACELMTTTVESMPVSGSPRQQAETIEDQDLAVTVMLTEIERGHGELIRADRPAQQWLDDWTRLLAARDRFRTELLRRGEATFVAPVDSSGNPLHQRMEDVWLGDAVCAVPPSLLWPYPRHRTSEI
ncbi:hypothetical protein [Aeromicrobium sp. P5_D10]